MAAAPLQDFYRAETFTATVFACKRDRPPSSRSSPPLVSFLAKVNALRTPPPSLLQPSSTLFSLVSSPGEISPLLLTHVHSRQLVPLVSLSFIFPFLRDSATLSSTPVHVITLSSFHPFFLFFFSCLLSTPLDTRGTERGQR